MKTFYRCVDLRSREQMTSFLKNHFRYPTMNSWNCSTSYACNLKIHSLGLDADLTDRLYDMLELQEFFSVQKELLYEFGKQHRFLWQACMNGRSGGYLVLYQGEMRESGYQSYCTCCGQKNYRRATADDCICGVCRQPNRVNFPVPDRLVVTFPGRGTDEDGCFDDWSIEELKERVRLVQELDQLADQMVLTAVRLCRNYEIQTETIYVPQKRRVLISSTQRKEELL